MFRFSEFIFENESKLLSSLITVLDNANEPLTVSEIMDKMDLSVTTAKNPRNSISTRLNEYSDNSRQSDKNKKSYFTVVSENPLKFWLIDRINELDISQNKEIIYEPDSELNNTEDIKNFKIFKPNPFRQSICVLGESGAGKSVTIETILENEGHNFEFIIPTAATTGLLAQFSPSKSGYVASRLGRMLIEASKNPDTLYTAVFDEMHKSNVIEMINDELLQSISTKRNRGRRFISLDDDTAEIYQGSELDTERGNLLIPDNFGFIFISSKPRVIANNADFFNRVDIVLLKSYQEEMVETTEQLLSNKLGDEEKMKLASTRND